jgi:hypothetical protein
VTSRVLHGAVAVLFGCVALMVAAPPASAHSVSGVAATNYETRLVRVQPPPPPGLEIRVVEVGSRLEVTNKTATELMIVGYTGEPYLRIDPGGVFENLESPSTYINASRKGSTVPEGVDGTAVPRWRKVSSGSTARWHDHRTHWMGSQDHPIVRRAPDRPHLLGTWSVPMRLDATEVSAEGTLRWTPGPSPVPWLALAVLVAAAAGVVVWRPPSNRRPLVVAALLAALLVVDVSHATGSALASADPVGDSLGRLAANNLISIAGWVAVLAAIVLLLRRRPLGWSLAVLGSLVVLGAGGVIDLVDLSSSQVPFEPSAVVVRVLLAMTLGLGATTAMVAGARVVRPD